MREKKCLAYPIIVEGKYDQIKVSSLFNGVIISTSGFRIFRDEEKDALIRSLAQKSKIILLSDSDHAGQMIRGHIGSIVSPDRLIQLYIPQVRGKEKRKNKPGAENLLGVEGMDASILLNLLEPYTTNSSQNVVHHVLRSADMYALGLSGRSDSQQLRNLIAPKIGLPCGMTANTFRVAAELLIGLDDLKQLVKTCTIEVDK